MDPVRTTPFIHRWWLPSRIETEEKRHLWLGPVHQVATKAHATRVRLPMYKGICQSILSNISGGRITDAFGSDGLDPWVTAHQVQAEKRGMEGGLLSIAHTVCQLWKDTSQSKTLCRGGRPTRNGRRRQPRRWSRNKRARRQRLSPPSQMFR